jgi:hypothetical protein
MIRTSKHVSSITIRYSIDCILVGGSLFININSNSVVFKIYFLQFGRSRKNIE